MMTQCYLRVLADGGHVLLFSNSGDAIEQAIDAAREHDEVGRVEMDEAPISDYVAPGVPAEAGDEAHHELYQYRVEIRPDVDAERFKTTLASHIRQAFMHAGTACDIIVSD